MSLSNARKLFLKDNSEVGQRDRRDFATFDDMPHGLKLWWVARAKNYEAEGKYGLSDTPAVSNGNRAEGE